MKKAFIVLVLFFTSSLSIAGVSRSAVSAYTGEWRQAQSLSNSHWAAITAASNMKPDNAIAYSKCHCDENGNPMHCPNDVRCEKRDQDER